MEKRKYQSNWESVRSHPVPEWYEDCKFGIFIHWGIYSVPAYAPHTWELGEVDSKEWFMNNPYAEWYYNSINIGEGHTYERHVEKYGKDFRYEDFIPEWKAQNWDPEEWASLFREAGAGFVVLTTKHHDGFCLFPSRYTDFNSTKMGPMRDITGELTRAVRAVGLKMGLYYSGLIDWQFTDDPILEDADLFDTASPTFAYADYSYNQMMELVDTYHPSVFWNDIGWPKQSEAFIPYFLAHYYNTVPEGVINDRFNGLVHDYLTKEYKAGASSRNEKWELCRGMGYSFGYNENEGDDQLITTKDLVALLVRTVANNGSLLLNIGPKADGTIPEEQARRLKQLGAWLKKNGEGIYGSRICEEETQNTEDGLELNYTRKNGSRYVFVTGLEALKSGEEKCFLIPGWTGRSLLPLEEDIEAEYEETEAGLVVKVSGYRSDMYTLCFKQE